MIPQSYSDLLLHQTQEELPFGSNCNLHLNFLALPGMLSVDYIPSHLNVSNIRGRHSLVAIAVLFQTSVNHIGRGGRARIR